MNTISARNNLQMLIIKEGQSDPRAVSEAAAQQLTRALADEGITPTLIRLSEYELVVSQPHEKTIPMDVYWFRQQVQQSDGVLLVAPEANGTFHSNMKRALNCLQPHHVLDKPVGCVGLGVGVAGGARAMAAMMQAMHALGAAPLVYGVFISKEALVMTGNVGFEFSRAIYLQLRALARDVTFAALQRRIA
jgi:NAD(P)H-dependent FMN reductase